MDDAEGVIERSHLAWGEFVKGDPQLALQLFSHRDDVTVGNPFGPFVRGWEAVSETVARAATNYRDVSGQVVLESWQPGGLPNDPNRCITVQFLEFPALQGATSYTAVVLNQVLGVNQTFQAAPPWPADSYTVSVGPANTHTFVAPGSSHRMVLGSESSGRGCNSSPRFTVV